jgi:hypothetical protein
VDPQGSAQAPGEAAEGERTCPCKPAGETPCEVTGECAAHQERRRQERRAERARKAAASAGPPQPDPIAELERRFHEGKVAPEAAGVPTGVPHVPPSGVEAAELESLRSSNLGRRLAKRRGFALAAPDAPAPRVLSTWALAILCAVAAWSLWSAREPLTYWLSNEPAIDLGHLGAYDLGRAREGAFAKAQGIASPQRGTSGHLSGEHELFPLVASRILVDRPGAPDPAAKGYGFPWTGEGRLSRADPGGRWAAVREKFVALGELARTGDVWVLEQGVVPGKGVALPLEVAAWTLLGIVSGGLLLRRALARAGGPR